MAVRYVNYLSIRLLPIKKKKKPVIYPKSLWDFTLTVSRGSALPVSLPLNSSHSDCQLRWYLRGVKPAPKHQ